MKQLDPLGCEATDKVSGMHGTIISISFDLVGCVQGYLSPPFNKKTQTQPDGRWLDLARLNIGKRVMPHGYDTNGSPRIDKGPVEKPSPSHS